MIRLCFCSVIALEQNSLVSLCVPCVCMVCVCVLTVFCLSPSDKVGLGYGAPVPAVDSPDYSCSFGSSCRGGSSSYGQHFPTPHKPRHQPQPEPRPLPDSYPPRCFAPPGPWASQDIPSTGPIRPLLTLWSRAALPPVKDQTTSVSPQTRQRRRVSICAVLLLCIQDTDHLYCTVILQWNTVTNP